MIRTLVIASATLALIGLVYLAAIGVNVTSANTDSDWSIEHTYYQDTVTLNNLDGYQIEFWAGECVLRLGAGWAHLPGDTLTIRVSNAMPQYDLHDMGYPVKITSCVTRN